MKENHYVHCVRVSLRKFYLIFSLFIVIPLFSKLFIAKKPEPEGVKEGSYPFENTGFSAADSYLHLKEAPKKGLVRISYFVQVSPDSIELVPRLLEIIHDEENVYIIHVDKKIEERKYKALNEFIKERKLANVHFIGSEMVTYKGVTMVLNTLSAMEKALKVEENWDYFINLSSSDYPLINSTRQRELLSRPNASIGLLNFFSVHAKNQWRPYAFRIREMYWDPAVYGVESRNTRLVLDKNIRKNPLEEYRHFKFAKAEAWMILSRPFAEFLVRSSFSKRMLFAHIHVRSSPEHYFINVLLNHPIWRQTLVPNAFRFVLWMKHRLPHGQHPCYLDDEEDEDTNWSYISSTRSMFARKFRKTSSKMMTRIDREVNGIQRNSNIDKETSRSFYMKLVETFDLLTENTLATQRQLFREGSQVN